MPATPIAMPRLGMTMEEGTVIDWPIAVGQPVEKGQIVLVIETEKAETEIEATASGVLRHVFAEPGETLPCGALLAALTNSPDEDFDADAFAAAYVPPPGSETESSAPRTPEPAAAPARASASRGERKPIAPAARALAKKLGVDLQLVDGSGPGGRVTKEDVQRTATARERLVSVDDGVALEVLRDGSGDPVLLLPGFGTDVSSFALQTPALAERFEVVGVNPRGVGNSDAPVQDAYGVARAADDVASVATGPSHVVGASLGAAVAIELALRHPEKVATLTLVTPFVTATPRLLAFAESWAKVASEASPQTVASFLAPWLFGDELLADDEARTRTLRGLAQSVKRSPPATLERMAAGMRAWSGTRTAHLERIAVPTLVLAGGADLLTQDAASIASSIPGANLEVLAGRGHALAIDAAEDVTRLLLAHVSR